MKRKNLHLLLIVVLLVTNLSVLALTEDLDKPINIECINQSIDLKSNISIFSGHVVMTQGSIKLKADIVRVTHISKDAHKIIVDIYGNPATFYQMQENGQAVQGHAAKLHYDVARHVIELNDNACIKQKDSNIQSDHITYFIKEKKFHAYSQGQKKHVTTVLVPSQLEHLNVQTGNKNKSN
ncbi:protein YhbN precursor [Candidatus Pantoea carbekii]|nr:protein YhbN precursor [Candidatus Pantoea carbekii]